MESHSNKEEAGRIPPQDIEAEKSLLGSILLSDESFPDILERVKPGDFYDKNHNAIYQAMVDNYNNARPIDLQTVRAELSANKKLKEVGGAQYLAELTNFVPTAAHAIAYADIVSNCAIRRNIIKTGTELIKSAYDGQNTVDDLLGDAEKQLFETSRDSAKDEIPSLETLSLDAFSRLEELYHNKGALRGLKTGFKDLDNITAGLQKGDLIIVGARPAMGKTTFAQNIAYNVASINKVGVLFFSMEMGANEIVDRIISDVSGVDNWNIRTGNVTEESFAQIEDALGEMGEVPLYIDDKSGLTIMEIRNRARRAKHDHDIGLIIVDYLTLIKGSDRYKGNRVQEVTEISQGLKHLARELDVPVVALAQLNREVTGRDDPRPVLSDLRESGSIEQDADLVMMLHRIDYYHHEDDYEPTNITELLIQKHRHGRVGKVELYFHPELLRFMSLDKKH
ncbi:replicative DNA helicase [Candidatus Saccharibacteria bacterium]|nr:replicative DNA helicase [Candidatus Saccharibacteria bacterium]